MRSIGVGAATILLVSAIGLLLAPVALARDSRFTIALTLQGDVPEDAAFSIGVGSSADYVCVSRAEQRTWPPGSIRRPVCRSGETYDVVLDVPAGTSERYVVFMNAPRFHDLWTGRLIGDGRAHRLSYVYVFGSLPATDTQEGSHAERAETTLAARVTLILAAAITGVWMWRRERLRLGHRARD